MVVEESGEGQCTGNATKYNTTSIVAYCFTRSLLDCLEITLLDTPIKYLCINMQYFHIIIFMKPN